MSAPIPDGVVFRLPRMSYVAVLLLVFGAMPLAFADNNPRSLQDVTSGSGVAGSPLTVRALFMLIPVVVAVFIARTATFVTADGIRVRALFGSRRLPWDTVRGLSVVGRAVYAVQSDGSVRLPCVRLAHLGALSRASGGRIAEIADPTPKPSPQRRRR